MTKPKRKLTAAEKRARQECKKNFMTNPDAFISDGMKTMSENSDFSSSPANLTRRFPTRKPAGVISRRYSLGPVAAGYTGLVLPAASGDEAKKVIVSGCAWNHALDQPNYDITPILDTVFADMEYAGVAGVEVMQTTLLPDNAVDRLAALAEKHRMPVIGASFVGAMWDRSQHKAILDEAESVVSRLGELGGRRLGITVGAPQGATARKTAQQWEGVRRPVHTGRQRRRGEEVNAELLAVTSDEVMNWIQRKTRS